MTLGKPHPHRNLKMERLEGWVGAEYGGLTCHMQDSRTGADTVVLAQGALRAGAEQKAAIRAGNQAGDGSSVTPVPHRDAATLTLSCTIPDLKDGPGQVSKGQQRTSVSCGQPCPTQAPIHPREPMSFHHGHLWGRRRAGYQPVLHQDLGNLQAEGADGPTAEATEEDWLLGVEGDRTWGLLR